MDVRRFESGPALLAVAGDMLGAREAENSLLVGLAQADRPFKDCELGMVAFSAGRPVAALLQTAINEAMVSVGVGVAMRALGRALAEAGASPRGVVGPRSEAGAAAGAFAARAGLSTRVERRLILHRIDRAPPAPPGKESLRPAAPADESLLAAWAGAFEQDTRTPEHARNAEQRVRQGIDSGRLFVLDDGVHPVAAASWSRPTRHTRTINCVYTPPEERGRGRGRATTALLTRRLLDAGARDVLIFTDADDPIPNRVYARVGFEPLAAFCHHQFVRARG